MQDELTARRAGIAGDDRSLDADAGQVLGPQRASRMRDSQALGEQQLQLVAEPPAPMAQVGALVREAVLEELLAGEVLKIGVVDPALTHLLIGPREDMLEQQKPDHEAGCCGGSALITEERRDPVIKPIPVELAGELHQLMLHVDDLVEPRSEQITFARCRMLLRPHRSPPMQHRIIVRPERESQK